MIEARWDELLVRYFKLLKWHKPKMISFCHCMMNTFLMQMKEIFKNLKKILVTIICALCMLVDCLTHSNQTIFSKTPLFNSF